MNLLFLNPVFLGAFIATNFMSAVPEQTFFHVAYMEPQRLHASIQTNTILEYNKVQTKNGVHIQKDTMTLLTCSNKSATPIVTQKYEESIHSIRLWMYEMDANSLHRFFVTKKEIAFNPEYKSLPSFSTIDGGHTYFIMSEKDLLFSCESGLQSVPECGNGIIENANEQCDDGNRINGDGCNNLCKISEEQAHVSTTDLYNVYNSHPLPDGSPIIPGKQMLAEFTFNFSQENKDQTIADIILSLDASNASMLAYDQNEDSYFELFNTQTPENRVRCDVTMINGTPLVSTMFSGKAYIICSGLEYSEMDSHILTGSTISIGLNGFVAQAKIADNQQSYIQVSLDHIHNEHASTFGAQQSHITWYSDPTTKEYIRWIDSTSSIIHSTQFSL